jgi:hypothetical protein
VADPDEKAKNKKVKEVKHAPLVKTQDEIKKSQFLGEKYGHFKLGSYVRLDLHLDKAISRRL